MLHMSRHADGTPAGFDHLAALAHLSSLAHPAAAAPPNPTARPGGMESRVPAKRRPTAARDCARANASHFGAAPARPGQAGPRPPLLHRAACGGLHGNSHPTPAGLGRPSRTVSLGC